VCGLTGFWQYDGGQAESLLRVVEGMSSTLAHRGPDDAGSWVDTHAGVALGFRRLAIIDLSPAGHQPMESADGRFVAVFNGEIYNFIELRQELARDGVSFRGRSDTEVMVEGAARWGVDAMIRRIAGMFAIVLWDRHERTLYLVRDRLGKKPLYYALLPRLVLFGSELKSLCAHPAFEPVVDRNALAAYCQYGYVPGPLAIYEGVRKLQPGCYAAIRCDGAMEGHRYWDPRRVAEAGLANPLTVREPDMIDELDGLMRKAVARRMIADVPLGAFLSGGIDSTIIVSLMQAQSRQAVRTFTIGFHEEAFDEAKAAKAVANHLGTDHTELYVAPEVAWSVIPQLPDLYDEPFADSSEIPTFLVSRLARQHVTVALSGDGGDELFAGYPRYSWAEGIWNLIRPVPHGMRRSVARMLSVVSPARAGRVYGMMERALPASWHVGFPGDKVRTLTNLLPIGDEHSLYRHLMSYWVNGNAVVRGNTQVDGLVADLDAVDRERFTFIDRMMLMDQASYLPEDILVKVDRASMGISLEARAPFLDHEIVEWSWRLPLTLKRRNGVSKWILRQILHRYVPAPLVERPKMGFIVPMDNWLRGPLRPWAEALLDDSRLRQEGFLEPAPIRRAWHEHLQGDHNSAYRLWVILMFQAWLERWQGSRVAPAA
jgi:asparagine synthase (glutamine-hydrolysing)